MSTVLTVFNNQFSHLQFKGIFDKMGVKIFSQKSAHRFFEPFLDLSKFEYEKQIQVQGWTVKIYFGNCLVLEAIQRIRPVKIQGKMVGRGF